MISASVAAVIAVYNGERTLGRALVSVLTQSRPPDELIVIDDGSTDQTASGRRELPPCRLLAN